MRSLVPLLLIVFGLAGCAAPTAGPVVVAQVPDSAIHESCGGR